MLKQKILKGVLWTAIGNWGYRGLSLLLFVILARLLTPEDFGVVAVAMVYIAFLQIFLEQGFAEVIVQRPEIDDDVLSTAFWVNIGFGIFFFGATFLAARFVSLLFQEPGLEPVVRGLSPLFIIIGITSVQMARLRREMEFRAITIASGVGILGGGVGGVLAALYGLGVWALVIYQIGNYLGKAMVVWGYDKWRPRVRFSRSALRELLSFGSNITGSRLLNYFNRYGADLIIGLFLGPVAVGYYNLGFRLTRTLVELTGSVISQVAFPTFSKLQFDPRKGSEVFYRAIEQISLLSFPLFIGMAALAEEIVKTVFGSQWLPAVPIMQVLALIGLLESLYYVNNAVLLGYGKPFWRLALDGLNAFTNLLSFVLVANWGVFAVACAYVVRGYITAPFPLVAVRKLIPIQFSQYFTRLVPSIAGSMVMVVFIYTLRLLLEPHLVTIWLLFVNIALGAFVYGAVLLLIAPNTVFETRDYVLALLGKNRSAISTQ